MRDGTPRKADGHAQQEAAQTGPMQVCETRKMGVFSVVKRPCIVDVAVFGVSGSNERRQTVEDADLS
eukprot:543297-Rhodomonas_salina.5